MSLQLCQWMPPNHPSDVVLCGVTSYVLSYNMAKPHVIDSVVLIFLSNKHFSLTVLSQGMHVAS